MQVNPYEDMEIPPVLRASLDRHLAQLSDLVKNLRAAGLNPAQIEQSVCTLVESYRNELIRSMKALAR